MALNTVFSDLPRRTRHAALPGWLLLAFLSLASTWWSVSRSGWSGDYWGVRAWLSVWQSGGNPYTIDASMDYPPWALIVLTPLSWLRGDEPQLVFLAINIATACAFAWHLVRWTSEWAGVSLSSSEGLAYCAMLLATRTMRMALISGQTMPMAALLLVMCVRLSTRHPFYAGVCFALGSFKLNLAVGFGLILFATGNWMALLSGIAWTAALFGLSTAAMHETPWALTLDYARSLWRTYYGGTHLTTGVTGVTGVRGLIAAVTNDHVVVMAAYAAVTATTLAVLGYRVRAGLWASANAATISYATLLWAMLALPHANYNVTLVLPALWLLAWPETRVIRRRWLQLTCAAIGLLYFIPSVPFALEQRLLPLWNSFPPVGVIWPHRARLLVLGLFAVFLARLAPRSDPDFLARNTGLT